METLLQFIIKEKNRLQNNTYSRTLVFKNKILYMLCMCVCVCIYVRKNVYTHMQMYLLLYLCRHGQHSSRED